VIDAARHGLTPSANKGWTFCALGYTLPSEELAVLLIDPLWFEHLPHRNDDWA
jgi:hypothetical protein